MNDKRSSADQAFLEKQRARLLKLQAEVLKATRTHEREETGIDDQALGQANEAEDDAQRLALLETEGAVVRRNIERLPMIERALRKISDGTYGFSDASGRAIPRERLEAIPEALYTADEEAGREAKK